MRMQPGDRKKAGAVIHDAKIAGPRIAQMVKEGAIITETGKRIQQKSIPSACTAIHQKRSTLPNQCAALLKAKGSFCALLRDREAHRKEKCATDLFTIENGLRHLAHCQDRASSGLISQRKQRYAEVFDIVNYCGRPQYSVGGDTPFWGARDSDNPSRAMLVQQVGNNRDDLWK